jgi:hypothetical protein
MWLLVTGTFPDKAQHPLSAPVLNQTERRRRPVAGAASSSAAPSPSMPIHSTTSNTGV